MFTAPWPGEAGSFDVLEASAFHQSANPPPPTRAVATFRVSLQISGDPFDPYRACLAKWNDM